LRHDGQGQQGWVVQPTAESIPRLYGRNLAERVDPEEVGLLVLLLANIHLHFLERDVGRPVGACEGNQLLWSLHATGRRQTLRGGSASCRAGLLHCGIACKR
jgi:hypothetical protein